MTREEKIEKQAKEFVDNYMQSCVDYRSLGYHQRKTILNVDLYKVEEVYEEAANWADKTMLDRACEWLKKNIDLYAYESSNTHYPEIKLTECFETAFRQAMEGGAE